jgi:hypothetical protein
MHDLKNNIKVSNTLVPAVRTTDANGTGFDRKDYPAIMFAFNFGASGDTLSGSVKVAGVVQESDDNSTYTDVVDADLIGTEPLVDAPGEASTTYVVGYKGNKRYVRGMLDFTGTHTNGIGCSVVILGGNPRNVPVT